MAKRKGKTDTNPVSEKQGSNKTKTQPSTEKKLAKQDQGSLSSFLRIFFSGVGFGGAFLFISVIVLVFLLWLNKSYFLSNNSESWQVEYNQPHGIWRGDDVLKYVQKSNPELFNRSYSDPMLLKDVSNSFNLSPIVKNVKFVQRRFPNTIVLNLEYFEPVAMVYVTSVSGFYPVDKDGCRLPTNYFKEMDINKYLAIKGINSLPMNPVGQPWNDIWVETASKIASELIPYKDEMGFNVIYVHESSEDERFGHTPVCFDVRLKNKTFIRWNEYIFKATGEELIENELSTDEKIAILRQRLKEKGEIKPDSPDEMLRFIPKTESNSETKSE